MLDVVQTGLCYILLDPGVGTLYIMEEKHRMCWGRWAVISVSY